MRLIYDPHIRRDISVLALNATVHGIEKQLQIFFNHGGNTLHIHEEGGGTELRESLGRWLSDNRFNADTIFCCMIGHDSEDGLQRKDPDSLNDDISLHRELLKAPILHLVYLDPPADKSANLHVIETLAKNIHNKSIGNYAFRNWDANEIREVINYVDKFNLPRPAAIITTELSSAVPNAPLWEGYIPFDSALREAVIEFDLTVWFWLADINQPLFVPPNERSWFLTKERMERWASFENENILSEFSKISSRQCLTLRQVNALALLRQPFRAIGIISKDAANLTELEEFYSIAKSDNFL